MFWWERANKAFENFKKSRPANRNIKLNELYEADISDAYNTGYKDGREDLVRESSAIIASANGAVYPPNLQSSEDSDTSHGQRHVTGEALKEIVPKKSFY